ncbi:retrotransposon protein, putative, ty1-copia subclass [Tanacetum coccineum]
MEYEEPLDLVDTRDESVYESLIEKIPICSLNFDFRIEKEDPSNLKIPCMIGRKFIANAYIDIDSPMNVMSLAYYNIIRNQGYEHREENFVGIGKDMHVYIGNMSRVMDFTIMDSVEANIDPSLSQIVFGRPFVEITRLTLDKKNVLITFIDGIKEVTFKTPYRDPELDDLTSEGHDLLSSRMALHAQNINNSAFRLMFEREKLSSLNFNDWFRSLKLALRVEKKLYVIAQPIPHALIIGSTNEAFEKWNKIYDFHNEVACLMLRTGVERFDLIQTFHACKQEEEKFVSSYVLKMKGYVEQLERLGYVLPQEISVGLILNGITSDFVGFVRNYNMHNMGKTVGELHTLLIEYEKGLPKKAATPQVLVIQGGRIHKPNKKPQAAKGKGKAKRKGKNKLVYGPKPKNLKHAAKQHPVKDDACHHYKEVGHWKRNCLMHLAKLIKKKKQAGTANTSGIFTIELFSFPNKSWVYDTSCGTYICNPKHGLRGERKLKQGAIYLYVGNGVRAQVEAIRSFDLVLPNGLVICLDNCHYAHTITRGVVSVSCLVDNYLINCFMDYGILVSKNDVLYFNDIPRDRISEIDMLNLVPNVNSIYNASSKKAKHNLDSTYLWHYRLAHISKKRIEKLQHDGLLNSTDSESFNQCLSCLSGKLTRKPFLHRMEWATDLLGLIHLDVCGPLRHVSRQGASYFLTFTDDFSRYGYVYLLKHKHEVFVTFEGFKNEVENQLGKTIKALRLDRGGEYISQGFKDYLKVWKTRRGVE